MYEFKNEIMTDEGTIYTCDASYISAIIIGLNITNININNVIKINLIFHRASDSIYIFKDIDLASNETIVPIGYDQKLILKPNDYLELTSDYTGSDYLNTSISLIGI